jgi:hypothetical protein
MREFVSIEEEIIPRRMLAIKGGCGDYFRYLFRDSPHKAQWLKHSSGEVGWVVKSFVKSLACYCMRISVPQWVARVLLILCVFRTLLAAQTLASDSPVPILTGNTGYFTNVQGGKVAIVPEFNPVLLIPLGDRWLVEARGEFEGDFERKNGNGPFGGQVQKELDYLQVDCIANPYVTITAGRFLTPFGIYNERLYPIWIRSLQTEPLIFPIGTGSSNGAMLRGGLPVSAKVNLNYAAYFSVLDSNDVFHADRTVGGRMGFFLPGPRIEAGVSWQKLLQEDRSDAFGFHFAWQPAPLPLNLRSEYARSNIGSGYWIEAAYRLSQVAFWRHAMRRVEVVGRAQQLFAGQISEYGAQEYGVPDVNTRQGDFGLNYFLRDGLKATASYGRQFNADGNFNLWTVGIAYRFLLPLGRVGPQ